jgi:hypothetical protein
VITFSADPQFHMIKGDNLAEKVASLQCMAWVSTKAALQREAFRPEYCLSLKGMNTDYDKVCQIFNCPTNKCQII